MKSVQCWMSARVHRIACPEDENINFWRVKRARLVVVLSVERKFLYLHSMDAARLESDFNISNLFSCDIFKDNKTTKTGTYIFCMHSRDCCITPSLHERLQLLHGLHLPQDFLIVTLLDLYLICSDMNLWISKSLEFFSLEVEFATALISFSEFSDFAEIFRLPCELLFMSTSAALLPMRSFEPSIWLLMMFFEISNATAASCFSLFSLTLFALSSGDDTSTTSLVGFIVIVVSVGSWLLLLSLSKLVVLLLAKINPSLLLIVS